MLKGGKAAEEGNSTFHGSASNGNAVTIPRSEDDMEGQKDREEETGFGNQNSEEQGNKDG